MGRAVTVPEQLRVLELGTVSPLRSQTLWHAIAKEVSGGETPTLSFLRTDAGCVSIGYHRSLDEVDVGHCSRRGWPVYRRMVGGGPVFLDGAQLLFQISLPAKAVPASRGQALRSLLGPAVAAFRAAGVPARLDEEMEVVVADRKVCGYGAGQIDAAVVLVGNLIESFDHESATSVLEVPDPVSRSELLRLMRRYVGCPEDTSADARAFIGAAVDAFAGALGLRPRSGELSGAELDHMELLDRKFVDGGWLAGPDRPRSAGWKAKIRSGVWVLTGRSGGVRVRASVVGNRVERMDIEAPGDGEVRSAAAGVTGRTLAEARALLCECGAFGRAAAEAIGQAGVLVG